MIGIIETKFDRFWYRRNKEKAQDLLKEKLPEDVSSYEFIETLQRGGCVPQVLLTLKYY